MGKYRGVKITKDAEYGLYSFTVEGKNEITTSLKFSIYLIDLYKAGYKNGL